MTARERILTDQARESAAGKASAAHLTERRDVDRAAEAEHPWERSSAEERDAWWNTDYGLREDW